MPTKTRKRWLLTVYGTKGFWFQSCERTQYIKLVGGKCVWECEMALGGNNGLGNFSFDAGTNCADAWDDQTGIKIYEK